MAKQEFLANFRAARNLFAHPRAQVDNSQLDPQSIQHRLIRGAIWLTPKSVGGFHADDFSELGVDRRRELSDAVREFRDVAKEVGPTEPATLDQYQGAKAAFDKLRHILDPYIPTHQEAIKLREALQTVEYPEWVASWNYELGSDSDGAPAVWVTIYVDEQIAPLKQLGRLLTELTAKIQDALSSAGINRWPYVLMRGAVEHKSMA